jgi:hypothetical protein
VSLYSPDAPSYADEVEGIPHEEPVMTMEARIPSGLCAIVSQDCDLSRTPDIEPYVLIAPLTPMADKTYREAADGLSSRFFAYPRVEGREDKPQLVVDMRLVSSLEKTALLSEHIERIPCPLSDPKRDALREFLGRRLGRHAFPDEIVRQVVDPIERALARVHARDHLAGTFASVAFIGLSWTPGKSYCSLLVLLDPSLRERYRVTEQDVDSLLKHLRKQLAHFARDGDYTIVPTVHDVTEVGAVDILSHEEVTFEVDLVDLQAIAAREAEAHAAD